MQIEALKTHLIACVYRRDGERERAGDGMGYFLSLTLLGDLRTSSPLDPIRQIKHLFSPSPLGFAEDSSFLLRLNKVGALGSETSLE